MEGEELRQYEEKKRQKEHEEKKIKKEEDESDSDEEPIINKSAFENTYDMSFSQFREKG